MIPVQYLEVKIQITKDDKGNAIIDTQLMGDDFEAQMSGLIDASEN